METVAEYLRAVICAAVLGGILTALLPEKAASAGIIRFMAGISLILTVIQPLARFDFSYLEDFVRMASADLQSPVEEGQSLARKATAEIIKAETEAYILDKARALGAEMQVEVALTDDDLPVPCSVTISGAVSPYAKAQLEKMLTGELGIAKENQRWI